MPIPPPPLPPLTISNINFRRNSTDQNNNKLEINECLWAVTDFEVQRACFFSRVCQKSSPKECVYLKVNPILQTGNSSCGESIAKSKSVIFYILFIGPTCGLCSLSMLFSGTPSADDLLKEGQSLKYTNNGEIFSAEWLLQLLKNNLASSPLNPNKTCSYIYDGNLDSEFIKEKIQQHCMLLVPYDADRNHLPSTQNGKKAHWCLLIGFLIDDDNDVS